MCIIEHNEKPARVIFHFNKAHLSDSVIPMWVLKSKGKTHYVNHVEFDSGIGFRTKETPDSNHTKGSIQIKGRLKITEEDSQTIGEIY